MVKHEHASGAYNRRREECDEGVKTLRGVVSQHLGPCEMFRLEQLEQQKTKMPATIYKRCLHVVAENCRVQEGAKILNGRRGRPVRRSDAGIASQSSRAF